MTEDWHETRREFQRICAREGVQSMAARLPADRETVYRIIRGETKRPSLAIRDAIDRVVHEAEQEKQQ